MGVIGQNDVTAVCGEEPGFFCEWAYDLTGSRAWTEVLQWAVERPLLIIVIVVIGWVVVRMLRRSVERFGSRYVNKSEQQRIRRERNRERGIPVEELNGREEQRARTVMSVLLSSVSIAVWLVVALLVLGVLGISLAPVVAGAGVVGIMLGFGAQKVVADFLAGTFMLIEDQFGVGDVIDVGDVTGTVEKVSLRVTTLRDVNGTVWHFPNSEISRVGNLSQLWSRAVLDIDVAYDTDLRRAEGVIQRVADELWSDPDFDKGDILEPPEVWGIQDLGADGVSIRLVVKTDPAEQWVVGRELRLRIKEAFDEAGIEIPFPQRTIWVRQDEETPRHERPEVELAPIRSQEISDDPMENAPG
ncbi:MAG: mechanosensitive ion channel family protein [Actinomycetota bacterium]